MGRIPGHHVPGSTLDPGVSGGELHKSVSLPGGVTPSGVRGTPKQSKPCLRIHHQRRSVPSKRGAGPRREGRCLGKGGQRERVEGFQVATQCLGCKLNMKWSKKRAGSPGQKPEGRRRLRAAQDARLGAAPHTPCWWAHQIP